MPKLSFEERLKALNERREKEEKQKIAQGGIVSTLLDPDSEDDDIARMLQYRAKLLSADADELHKLTEEDLIELKKYRAHKGLLEGSIYEQKPPVAKGSKKSKDQQAEDFLKNERDVKHFLGYAIEDEAAADLSEDGLKILFENQQEEKQAKAAEKKDAEFFAATEKLEMPPAAPAKKKRSPAPR